MEYLALQLQKSSQSPLLHQYFSLCHSRQNSRPCSKVTILSSSRTLIQYCLCQSLQSASVFLTLIFLSLIPQALCCCWSPASKFLMRSASWQLTPQSASAMPWQVQTSTSSPIFFSTKASDGLMYIRGLFSFTPGLPESAARYNNSKSGQILKVDTYSVNQRSHSALCVPQGS